MNERLLKVFNGIAMWFSHTSLREKARTLQYFNIAEHCVIVWACYEVHHLLRWYMSIMTAEKFNAIAFWGAVGSIVAAIFGALNFMAKTLQEQNRKDNGSN